MQTITTTFDVYSFDELSDEAKQNAVSNHQYIEVESEEWWDSIYEYWQTKLDHMGFCGAEINFSGFSSQGDGASFICEDVEILELSEYLVHGTTLRKQRVISLIEHGFLSGRVKRDSFSYVHDKTVSYDSDYQDFILSDEISEIDEILTELVRELSRCIYADLGKEYDYLTSGEYIVERLQEDEYLFLIDGTTYNG